MNPSEGQFLWRVARLHNHSFRKLKCLFIDCDFQKIMLLVTISGNLARVMILPGEPSNVRLITALTVADSYITTLSHAEDSFSLLRLILWNDVRNEFTIHVQNDILVLSYRLHISWRHVQLLAAVRSPKWLQLQNQDQRSEPEAESQVRSTSDDVLHAVSIPAYESHRWKEDSCSPNLGGDLAQGANKI